MVVERRDPGVHLAGRPGESAAAALGGGSRVAEPERPCGSRTVDADGHASHRRRRLQQPSGPYYEVKERFFRIEWNYDSTPPVLRAVVLAPRGRSIQQQLIELHVADRRASLDELRTRLQVDRFKLFEKSCPAVRKGIESLRKLRLSLPTRSDVIIVDPEVFRVVEAFGDGHIDATLLDSAHVLARRDKRRASQVREMTPTGPLDRVQRSCGLPERAQAGSALSPPSLKACTASDLSVDA
jgi:hypothetical protein